MDNQVSNTDSKNFKFKELKTYSSTEWLADNKKKYRQVFNRKEVDYIYAELSFYNKMFDRKSWEVDIELKCFEVSRVKKKICQLDFKKKIDKYENVAYIREGWGNKKEGAFWKKGTFFWEAWIDGELVGTKYFYVEDFGTGLKKDTRFLPVRLKSLRLYEGQYDDVIEEERKYLTTFSNNETRYIYTEIHLENISANENWHCEFFVKFYNQARELKGQVVRLHNIRKGENTIKITAGWGANTTGSWKNGEYSVEVIFMDSLLAMVDFEVGDEFKEGLPVVKTPDQTNYVELWANSEFESFDQVFNKLNNLIGLTEIKKQVVDHSQYLEFLRLRRNKGYKELEEINLHSVFKGNPGTGKTTVAQMLGKIYRKMGLLSKGHVVEADRVDLVGEYIGQTAPKTKEMIKKARGGILFIDEAYSLARANDDSKDFGKEAIEILIKELSNGKGDLAVIVAGYPTEMDHFMNSNPGLRSRFKHQFDFPDYIPQELFDIAMFMTDKKEISFDDKGKDLLLKIITAAYRDRDKTFGNARYVNDLLDKIKMNMGLRLMARKNPEKQSRAELGKVLMSDIKPLEDVKISLLPEIPIDEILLKVSLDDLNDLIGIENIKNQIFDLVNIVRYYRAVGKNVLSSFSLHTVFVGNPGTGKTTVARILTQIYKALGLLERGHLIETDRQGLVAGFVGQTAIKTAEKIDEALDGVLFIDEAYALSNFNGLQGDYGNEAIQTILKKMEDLRGRFFVFVAGYPDYMDVFLKANPGLSSRFDKMFVFDDYTPSQLYKIGLDMISKDDYKLGKGAGQVFDEYVKNLFFQRDKFFGNARTIRTLVNEIIKEQNLRMSILIEDGTLPKSSTVIEIEDIKRAFKLQDSEKIVKSGIGFKP